MMQDNDKIIIVQAITNKLNVDLAMFLFKTVLVEVFCLKMFQGLSLIKYLFGNIVNNFSIF